MIFLRFLAILLVAVVGFFLGRRYLRQRAERAKRLQEFRSFLREVRKWMASFEGTQDFDEQIHALAMMEKHCAQAFQLLRERPEVMDITIACQQERRMLAQQAAVSEAERYMQMALETPNLRARVGRMNQVVQSLKVGSRLLFPHERITNAMRSAVQYEESLEGVSKLPEAEQTAAGEKALELLKPYFEIVENLKEENARMLEKPWPHDEIQQKLDRLESQG